MHIKIQTGGGGALDINFYSYSSHFSIKYLTSSYSEVMQEVSSMYITPLWSVSEFGTNKPPLNLYLSMYVHGVSNLSMSWHVQSTILH